MLQFQINDSEIEHNIKQVYGEDTMSLARAFVEFLQHKRLKEDIDISIEQLNQGQGIALDQVINDICAKYE